MKHLNSILTLLAVIAASAFIGCTTTTTTSPAGTVTTTRVVDTNAVEFAAAAIKIAAKEGALYAISQDANARAYFQLSAVALDTLLVAQTVDSATLANSLNKISVSEVRDNTQIKAIISDVIDLYRATEGKVLAQKLAVNTTLVQLVTAIRDGFTAALALSGGQ